jgi:hypothetical protein
MRELVVFGGSLRAIARCRVRSRLVAAIVLGIAWLTAAFVGAPAGEAAPVAGPASAPAGAPSIGGCQIFPADNVWNTRIDTLPVHARSDAWISSVGSTTGLKADFGSGLWEGAPIGIPYTTAPGSQPGVTIDFYYDENDPGPYRIPPDPPIEGGGDHHVLVVDRDRCLLTEVFDATKLSDTTWEAGSGAIFNLGSNALRTDGWTSADAAGLPILPGLARYDEVAAGEIAHALRFTAVRTQGTYIWPARHEASSITDPNVPPMGARVRLKSSVNVSTYPAQVRVILTALQRYGMFLADNGSNWYMSGAPDERWNNDTLRQLANIKGNMLEFVDESSLMVHPDSGQVRSAAPPTATPIPPTATPVPPTPTPPPSCSPRPAARVELARTVPGRLDVAITPGLGPGAPNNRPRALRFGATMNARILVNGQQVASGARVSLPNGIAQAHFALERIQADQGATVPLVLEDDCGDWSTFGGGGKSAW